MSNILPKKSWHVWKPENVERVLKDEAAQRTKDEALAAAEMDGNRASRLDRLRGKPSEDTAPLHATAGHSDPPGAPPLRHVDLLGPGGFALFTGGTPSSRSAPPSTPHPEFQKEVAKSAQRALERERLADVPFGGRKDARRPVWKAPPPSSAPPPSVRWGDAGVRRAVQRLQRDRGREDPASAVAAGLKSAALARRMQGSRSKRERQGGRGGRAGAGGGAPLPRRSRSPPPSRSPTPPSSKWAALRQQRKERERSSAAGDAALMYG